MLFVLLAAPLLWVVLAFVHPDGEEEFAPDPGSALTA
jgi:hypothetical protein